MEKFKTVEMSLGDLRKVLMEIELEAKDYAYNDRYGDIYRMMWFDADYFNEYKRNNGRNCTFTEFVDATSDQLFKGYKVGDKGDTNGYAGGVIEFEIINNDSLFEKRKYIKKVDGIILKVQIPLIVIERCKKEMGYNPFSEFI
ncbi:hypothetical protein CFT12S00416_05430 [Campylobacter fetus subsp. testudinum]|uniref:hypothetical protein n=1 Tax=Campylobacter fetus TaxID=196 RepID=UPI000818A818|nr:hypothetical protein [Campylobacter fetus]OCR88867.1 hypothetical protein CFT12S00416_05430 [Campylobacter fetus subsp. testudinum]